MNSDYLRITPLTGGLTLACLTGALCWRLAGQDVRASLEDLILKPVYRQCRISLSSLLAIWVVPCNYKLRNKFRKYNFGTPTLSPSIGHPHGDASVDRNHYTVSLDAFLAQYVTKKPYVVSMSKAERAQNFRGSKLYYSLRDIVVPTICDDEASAKAFKFVDVDYYADLAYFSSYLKPMIMYTFNPQEPAGIKGALHYSTLATGEVKCILTSGTRYVHPLWDHDHDFVCFPYGFYDYYYFVEVRRLGDTGYCIVLYEPAFCLARFIGRLFGGQQVASHRNDVRGSWAATNWINQSGEQFISIAPVGSQRCVTIPFPIYDSLQRRLDRFPKTFEYGAIDSVCGKLKGYNRYTDTPLVMDYLHAHSQVPEVSTSVEDSVGYIVNPNVNSNPNSGDYARRVHAPLDDNGAAPNDNYENEASAVVERVVSLQASLSDSTKLLTAEEGVYVSEFLLLLGEPDSLLPWSIERVLEQQNRPSQVLAYGRILPYFGLNTEVRANSFIKREAYPEFKAPRVITQVDAQHRVVFSSYTLALAEHCKIFPWYAFGQPPNVIAQRVKSLANRRPYLVETDYSRFDGYHSGKFAEFEQRVFKYFFGDDAEALIKAETDMKSTTRSGYRYKTGYSRLSGSPCTSLCNTLCNALVCYIAARISGNNPKRAFANLGLYGGDDGLTYTSDPKSLETVAAAFGARLKCVIRRRGKWLTFLGRAYLDPWQSEASIYDVRRFTPKAHIVVASSQVDTIVAAKRKAVGYLVTDPETPLIREWCTFILGLPGEFDGMIDPSNYYARLIQSQPETAYPQLDHDDPLVLRVVYQLLGDKFPLYLQVISEGCTEVVQPRVPVEDLLVLSRGGLTGVSEDLLTTQPDESISATPARSGGQSTSEAQPTQSGSRHHRRARAT